MVDSRNFKKQNQKGQGLKKHKWIPLVVIVLLALILILVQYFMLDILVAVNSANSNQIFRKSEIFNNPQPCRLSGRAFLVQQE